MQKVLNIGGIKTMLRASDKEVFNNFPQEFISKGNSWEMEVEIVNKSRERYLSKLYKKESFIYEWQKQKVFLDIPSKRGIITSPDSDLGINRALFLLSCVYSTFFPLYGGLLFHSSCVVRNNQAYLFLGKSNAGKTTIAELSKNFIVLSDDNTIVRKQRNGFFCYSTPWANKLANRQKTGKFRLKYIFFLCKDKSNYLKELGLKESLKEAFLFHVPFCKHFPSISLQNVFIHLLDLFKKNPSFELHFQRKPDFWKEIEAIEYNDG